MAVTLEPCSHFGRSPPCVDAILNAGIARVVVALTDPDPRVSGRGLERLSAAGVEIVRVKPDQVEAAANITRGHLLKVTERRPFIQLKIAVGADGRIAIAQDGRPVWVTGPQARAHGHLLRARADAIVVGTGTVAADDPELTCRLPGLEAHSPVRVVIGDRPVAPSRRLYLNRSVPVWQFATQHSGKPYDGGEGYEFVRAADVEGRVWLPDVIDRLAGRGVTRLLVEGGPAIWRSFADARLADEIVLFYARGNGPPSEQKLAEAVVRYCGPLPVRLRKRRRVGGDDMAVFVTHDRTMQTGENAHTKARVHEMR